MMFRWLVRMKVGAKERDPFVDPIPQSRVTVSAVTRLVCKNTPPIVAITGEGGQQKNVPF